MAEESPTIHSFNAKSHANHDCLDSSKSESDQSLKGNHLPHDAHTAQMGSSFSRASGRLYKALRRKGSMTLPSKKDSKMTTGSRKKISLPRIDTIPSVPLNSTVEIPGSVLNHQRPLPPSPPPSPKGSLKATLSYHTEGEEEEPNDCSAELDPNLMSTGLLGDKSQNQNAASTFPNLGEILNMHDKIVGKHTNGVSTSHTLNVSTTAGGEVQSMPLKNALEKYDNHFPLRLKFMEGYCSEDSEHNLSTSEVYDIHFVKKTRVITLKDNNGFMHQISLASPVTFGLVYDPNSDMEEALTGHIFKYCSDIMAADIMPRVVCVTDAITNPDENNCVAQNEVLLVKGIVKPKFRGKRCLKVFSFLTYTQKLLPEESPGNFNTKPSDIRLHPQQIVECMSEPFPIQAIPYINSDFNDLPEKHFPFTGVVTLCNCTTETSLVASPISDNVVDEKPISLHLNQEMTQLEVEVISWRENSHITASSDVAAAVTEYEETNSMTDVYDDIIVTKQKPAESDTSSVYDDVMVVSSKQTEECYASVGEQNPDDCPMETEYDKIPFEMSTQATSTQIETHLHQRSIHSILQTILEKLDSLELEVRKLSQSSQFLTSSSCKEEDINQQQVAHLDESEIGDVLKTMGLEAYVPTFRKEHINGKVLLQCDETALRDDLGVSSKVHRLRLLQVIAGDMSIETLSPTREMHV